MFECIGWCVLRVPEDDENDEEFQQTSVIAEHIKSEWGEYFRDISHDWVNGQCFLRFLQAHNRGGVMHQHIDDMVKYITDNAPLSYGVIYILDDELPNYDDDFMVIKIAGRDVIRERDAVLGVVEADRL